MMDSELACIPKHDAAFLRFDITRRLLCSVAVSGHYYSTFETTNPGTDSVIQPGPHAS